MRKLFLMSMLYTPMTLFTQKFGHLNSQTLLQSLPEATAVQSKLEAKDKEYQKQIEDMQSELRRQAEAYDKSKGVMNTTKQAETGKSLQDMYNKIQQIAQDSQKAFSEEQQKQLNLILEKVRNAIAAVARTGNYVYIMEEAADQPLHTNEALSKNITVEVKAQLARME